MTPQQWERVKQVTADAFELALESRTRFVDGACVDDTDVRSEVLRLLAQGDVDDDRFLSSPPITFAMLLARGGEPEPAFASGELLAGRFRIERLCGRGGMGEVYAARDLALGETVALKTIRSRLAFSPDAVERFKREVTRSRRVTHPNICRVYDLFSHDLPSGERLWFLTMEFLDGRTLAQTLAETGPRPLRSALPLIRDLISALSAAHALGIVHGDLKPNNIMLLPAAGGRERAVVTDFGLAGDIAVRDGDAEPGAGTPAYMAPERFAGGAVAFAADQFALGLVLCEVLAGRRPELDRRSPETMRRQLHAWLAEQRDRGIPSRVRRAIARTLAFDPQRRFATVQEILPAISGDAARRRTRRIAALAVVVVGLAIFAVATAPGERVVDTAPLTSETGMAGSPSITPDGAWVAYSSDRAEAGNLDIWIQSATGRQMHRVTTDPAIDTDPAIAPDGKSVAFRSERQGGGLYVAETQGGAERLLAAGGRSPAYSPDAEWIAYWTGNRDDATTSGELYKIPARGGAPVRLAPGFADARYPAWTPDGRAILFEGCQTNASAPSACADWWVLPSDGGNAVDTMALSRLRAEHIDLPTPPVKALYRDEVIFTGARGAAMALWSIAFAQPGWRSMPPRMITAGDARERSPSVAASGNIAFGRATGALHIRRVPLDGGAPEGRVTNDAGLDGCPGISRDERWLYFNRRTSGARQLMLLDLATGRESLLLPSEDDKFWPVAHPDGDSAAVEVRTQQEQAIWLVHRNGASRKLCSSCSHPTSWFRNGQSVLYTTSKGEIAEVDAAAGRTRIILSGAGGQLLSGADWNEEWHLLLFTVAEHGGVRRAYAVRLEGDSPAPNSRWVAFGPGPFEMEQPHWSADAKTVYFLSLRDGEHCLWARPFDPAAGVPAGEPFAVMHYHDPRLTPDRTSPVVRGLSVGAHSVYVNVGEVTTAVWIGRLATPPWDAWGKRLFFSR